MLIKKLGNICKHGIHSHSLILSLSFSLSLSLFLSLSLSLSLSLFVCYWKSSILQSSLLWWIKILIRNISQVIRFKPRHGWYDSHHAKCFQTTHQKWLKIPLDGLLLYQILTAYIVKPLKSFLKTFISFFWNVCHRNRQNKSTQGNKGNKGTSTDKKCNQTRTETY